MLLNELVNAPIKDPPPPPPDPPAIPVSNDPSPWKDDAEIIPCTSNCAEGLILFIPTLPADVMIPLAISLVTNWIGWLVGVPK